MLRYSLLVSCILLCSFYTVFAQGNYDVYMQESPAGSGTIRPGIGVHTFKASENVTLTTAPKAGYHFVGWLGDVRDPSANRTSLVVDGPKIIIAVFERDEYAFEEKGPQISVGPEALYPRYDNYTNNTGTWSPPYNPPDYPDPDPDPGKGPPVPEVPEPATMMLFALGTWLVHRNRKNS
ncbi:MAG: PEP-CTERM sorting domain-containing protein [Phycisphaerales bacterium]